MYAVIGAAFGDEGKGLITHHLASRYKRDAIVVRFNGGAQAGHTVVTKDSHKHVFHHISSGTFAGATTFLSQFFISNPILLLEELKELQCLKLNPKIYIDPGSPVTTPYDMMINQIAEEFRGNKRHGSCGIGFSETIERNLHPKFSLNVADLENRQKTINTLHLIRKEWLPQRLQTLNILHVPKQWQTYIESDDIFDLYVNNLSSFLDSITVSRLDLANLSQPIIFEGAQGLMLDQNCRWFPHVTRSHTGLKNVIDLIKNVADKKLTVFYVTRSYFTRHGAGPLPYELATLPYQQVSDKTNVTNAYQGSLRYAWFNLTLLKSFIQTDLRRVPTTLKVDNQLAVTCLDQVGAQITFINNKKIKKEAHTEFLQTVNQEIQFSKILCSYGPTIDTLKKWE
jgi:adenylosuccinate synthase